MKQTTRNGILIIFSALLLIIAILAIVVSSSTEAKSYGFVSPVTLTQGQTEIAILSSSADWKLRFADQTVLNSSPVKDLTTTDLASIESGMIPLQTINTSPFAFADFYRTNKGINVIVYNSLSSETVAIAMTRNFVENINSEIVVILESTEDFTDFIFDNLYDLLVRLDTSTYRYSDGSNYYSILYSSESIILNETDASGVVTNIIKTFGPFTPGDNIPFPVILTEGNFAITITNSSYRPPILQNSGIVLPEVK